MRFYFYNGLGDSGYFSERNLIKAIYAAWNIEATLYLLNKDLKKIDLSKTISSQATLVFSPLDDNEFNSEILKEFGYSMEARGEFREIIEIKTGKVVKCDWSVVKDLT